MVSVYGMERSTFELLGGLHERGAAIHCIVNSWSSSPIVDLAVSAGASWAPGHYRVPLKWRRTSVGEAARLAWEVARVSGVLLREARRRRATHILVPDLGAALFNLPALALLRAAGVAVIARLGNAPEPRPLYRFLWGRVIDAVVTEFVANSKFTAAALAATGVSTAKTRIIGVPPPFRRERPASRPGATRDGRIIYVGQLIPPKGCHRLLEAVAMLVDRGHDVSLDVVGDVARWEPADWRGYTASLLQRARQPDLAGRVRFLGERDDVPALLAAAAVHCFPSTIAIREGFGIVTVEAKAAGIPSVVTPSGALPEVIAHGEDGFVCADDSAEAIAAGLEHFLCYPDRLAAAGRRAHASAQRFSRERLMADWLGVFSMPPGDARQCARAPGIVPRHAD
jgi:glycosyltransferase involved in cell wall biosynthesis